MVRTAGVERAWASPTGLKSLASTSFAMSAQIRGKGLAPALQHWNLNPARLPIPPRPRALRSLTAGWCLRLAPVVPRVQQVQEGPRGLVHPVVRLVLPIPARLAVQRDPVDPGTLQVREVPAPLEVLWDPAPPVGLEVQQVPAPPALLQALLFQAVQLTRAHPDLPCRPLDLPILRGRLVQQRQRCLADLRPPSDLRDQQDLQRRQGHSLG